MYLSMDNGALVSYCQPSEGLVNDPHCWTLTLSFYDLVLKYSKVCHHLVVKPYTVT